MSTFRYVCTCGAVIEVKAFGVRDFSEVDTFSLHAECPAAWRQAVLAGRRPLRVAADGPEP